MAVKCRNGHWYDANVYQSCPHCKRNNEKLSLTLDHVEEDDKTVSIADVDISLGEQLGRMIGEGIGDTIPTGQGNKPEDDEKTISFGFFDIGRIQPVTGWLVCLNGSEKGLDYRLHSGKNFIGRSSSMDVVLTDDKTISRNRHGSLAYDPKGNAFYLAPEEGNAVYLNGEMVDTVKRIGEDDVITVGETDLVLIPYCKEGRIWGE